MPMLLLDTLLDTDGMKSNNSEPKVQNLQAMIQQTPTLHFCHNLLAYANDTSTRQCTLQSHGPLVTPMVNQVLKTDSKGLPENKMKMQDENPVGHFKTNGVKQECAKLTAKRKKRESPSSSPKSKKHKIASEMLERSSNLQDEDNHETRQSTDTKSIGIQVASFAHLPYTRKLQRRDVTIKKLQKKIKSLERRLRMIEEENGILEEKLEKYKDEIEILETVKEECEEGDVHSIFLMDQIKNFQKERPRWSETTVRNCIVWRARSSAGYETARKLGIIKSPCKTTLDKYMGNLSSGTGMSPLAKTRLEAELSVLPEEGKFVSLVADCTFMRSQLILEKKSGVIKGFASLAPFDEEEEIGINPELATELLCYVLNGLSCKFCIPAEYFFVNGLTGEDMETTTRRVLTDVTNIGFHVVRVCVDNHPINASMHRKLSGTETVEPFIPHPMDQNDLLFLSYDYIHLLKNMWLQHLEREMQDRDGTISSKYVREVYQLQKHLTFKAVRSLKYSALYPVAQEKMQIKTALSVFSDEVISVLETLKNWGEKTETVDFSKVGPTLRFLRNIQKFFKCFDVSQRHLDEKFLDSDRKEYSDPHDERLHWLTNDFLDYLKEVQEHSLEASLRGFTDETLEATFVTIESNVECIRYLLKHRNFFYVLPRKLGSDCVEGTFSHTKNACHQGSAKKLDCRSAESAMKNIHRTGIILSSYHANTTSQLKVASNCSMPKDVLHADKIPAARVPATTLNILNDIRNPSPHIVVNLETASQADVGGYIVRCVKERTNCEECYEKLNEYSAQPQNAILKYTTYI
ncbi:hypothetical protein B566_EDAN013641 [Ephemera danica]|nr:hypothetical protein B566_EDAN013641 [Ephemera danica]